MDNTRNIKKRVLIADDSEMNRAILADMLSEEYDIVEAENGVEAISVIARYGTELAIILLDIIMPEIDGFGVLEEMNRTGSIADIPVIMISAENKPSSIERAYEMGVTDFISRPFDSLIVHRRVVNTILLYTKQKKLIEIAAKQIYEKEEQSFLMIEILSHIVEFRNGESGRHVRRVRIITELLLRKLSKRSPYYHFSRTEISTISTASALHDIGKIAIPERILNKPGRLTAEEFETVKTHSVMGGRILSDLDIKDGDRLVKTAYEICRWHHERYDGSGYPDGLRGDEIPISAQIVALADVYDALTSDRVYKEAIPHEKAIEMIANGECGKFNPLLIECLIEVRDELQRNVEDFDPFGEYMEKANEIVEDVLRGTDVAASDRTFRLFENERMKFDYFASLTNELQFEYSSKSDTMIFSPFCARRLNCPENITEPANNLLFLSFMQKKDIGSLIHLLRKATPENPGVHYECELEIDGGSRWFRIVARTLWENDGSAFAGFIGKAIDIHESVMKLHDLEVKASTDDLTGLLNHAGAKELIEKKLKEAVGKKFALVIFDLDRFKQANDTYGHMFGDGVLIQTASRLMQSNCNGEITARVGGDEFLVFLEYGSDLRERINRLFNDITGEYEGFNISLSMGIANTETVGCDYDELFAAADKALYLTKRTDVGSFRFYDDSIHGIFSVISPIDD